MPNNSVSLRKWMWRAFVQSALLPLILVETVLVAAYLLTNSAIRDAQVEHLRTAALGDLRTAASMHARLVNERLQSVSELAGLFAGQVSAALRRPAFIDDPAERRRLARTESGVLFSQSYDGRAASFYSAVTPAAEQDLNKVMRLAQLDPLMRGIEQNNGLVSAVYINTHDSYNRIWPWFDTPEQYPHDMDIPQYNFYYLADAKHNPDRDIVWTDTYVDPAGLGWMMSSLAPVYDEDRLEGVVGLDITVGDLLADISQLEVAWSGYAMLVSADLNILALPPEGERDLQLAELTDHSYDEAIRQEIFKPADFNLVQRLDLRELGQRLRAEPRGVIALPLNSQAKLIAWATVPETGWHLLTVVDEAEIFAPTNQLAQHYQRIGLLLIAGLVLFYLLFFAGMWIRSRQLSRQLQEPIERISGMMRQIGRGHWHPPVATSRISELELMADTTRQVGLQLDELETERREAREQISHVLESTTESLWEVDACAENIRFQGRLPGRLGLERSSLKLGEFLQRVHPDDVAAARTNLLPADAGSRIEAEYRVVDTAGHYHWLLGRGRVILHENGKPTRIAGTHVDIGALKATEEALRAASQQAQAASLAKSRFLSSMSHELRTPLNVIQGFAQLLQLDLSADSAHDSFRHQIREILKAADHLGLLVDDVLDLARIEAERPEIQLQTIDTKQFLQDCLEQVRPDIDSAGLQISLRLPDQPACVVAEPRRLRQIMLNLLSNAIKYNQPQGSIAVECRSSGPTWRLVVSDTGQGISQSNQQLLFKPFQRLGHENGPIKGTGIGLSLSRELAVLMGGQLGFRSEEGRGSHFWVELPQATTRGEPATRRACVAARKPEVICVMNDRPSRILVEHALAGLARVTLMSNDSQTVQRIGENKPQLLLIAIEPAAAPGERLLRDVRNNRCTQDLPVIVIGSGATQTERERVAELDVAVYLTEPLQIQDLRDAVERIMRHQSGARPNLLTRIEE